MKKPFFAKRTHLQNHKSASIRPDQTESNQMKTPTASILRRVITNYRSPITRPLPLITPESFRGWPLAPCHLPPRIGLKSNIRPASVSDNILSM
jgi:hypothetical protein